MASSSAAMEALLRQSERLKKPIDLVQTLHERQMKEVPARYILPSDLRPIRPLQAQHSLPVIDLAGLEDIDQRFKTVSQLAQASQEWGFFQIINHGIPLSLLETVKRVSHDFFDLSAEEKREQCPVRPGIHMLEGYGRFFDISDDTVLDWVDALVHYISPEWAKAVEQWPKTPSTYRETHEKYGEEIMRLIEKLLSLLSEGLGLNPNYIQTLIKEPLLQLRINYYFPCPQPDLVNGLRPHSDGDILTVLLDDGVEGLQVRKNDQWFPVAPVPGALIVNIGDLLQIVSNGKYKSAEHRVVANTKRSRMSIVMFFMPHSDVLIGAAPELIDEAHPSLYKAIKAGAKRGPPMMCIAACEAVGGSKEQALPTACALEMVHTASLIHDDLPCMDDDPIRRGQPSNHTVFGVDMAVLAGDALFPLGFEYIVSSTSDVPPDRIVKVIAQIAKTVGSQGMVAGQYMDLGSTGNNKFDPSLVGFIHERKFGIMAECSAVTGGIIGGATDEDVERLRNYGRSVGVLYQIADDILEEEALLEGNGGAIKKNKTSYPRAYGLEKAREIAETLRSNAKMELSGFDRGKSAPLYSFVDYAIDRSFDV